MMLLPHDNLNENLLEELLSSIHRITGFDFSGYARNSMRRRITGFMEKKQISTANELIQLLSHNNKSCDEFINGICVTVTGLFRDPAFYKALNKHVLPRLQTYPFIRIWSAGCATGEEAYSLAILLTEKELYSKSRIYATDINAVSLASAKKGAFQTARLSEYEANSRSAGITTMVQQIATLDGKWGYFDETLKRNIIFAMHNLAADTSFNEFNLILCRNVLYYFNHELQQKVIRLLLESLCMFGYLAVGAKETLKMSDYFNCLECVDDEHCIFRKVKDPDHL